MTAGVDETNVCVSCLTQNRQGEAFCHHCGAPIGTTATLEPLQTIRAEGFLFRKALEGRPKPIVLICIWILHLPVLVVGLGVAIYLMLNERGWGNFVLFWAMIGLSYFAFLVLYRITKNYLTHRNRA